MPGFPSPPNNTTAACDSKQQAHAACPDRSKLFYPLSAIRYPLSAIRYPLYAIRYPLSAIPYRPSTRFKITRARFTLSATAHVSFGLDPPISSRASRTAAIIDAQIATVLAYRLLCSFSQAICRFISPIATA